MKFGKAEDVMEAIANLIAAHLTDSRLNLGVAGNVVRVDVDSTNDQVVLRTDQGTVWYLLPIQLGSRLTLVSQHGKAPDFGHEEVRKSYRRYLELERQWMTIRTVVETTGLPELDTLLQTWVEDVLTDDDRECWFRWSPGGHATPQERRVVNANNL